MAVPKKSVAAKETGQEKANGSPPEFTKAQELAALRDMLLIRRFEEKAGQLYGMGAIGGFCHLYIGQEAVVVGMQMALKQGDQVITGYRDHGHMLACGMEANGVMAELTGRRGGYSKGKGGSMHMFSMEKNFYGGHGIVGAQVSLGTGLAFANRYRGNDLVSVAYFGDGASNQGQVYESFNMAELWKLPVIYVIENNRYAMGTSVTRSSPRPTFPSAASPSTFRASRSTAWTSAPSRRQATRRSPGAAPARGRSSWKCRPIATAATRCPTRPSTGPAKRSRRSAPIRTRSNRFATVCWPPRSASRN
jgi:TPP-dependent pyruvate/acetoin dehydrogenase alpha subunit